MVEMSDVKSNNRKRANQPASPETAGEVSSEEPDEHGSQPRVSKRSARNAPTSSPPAKAAAVLDRLRKLEQRAIELPIVGKLHPPDTPDVAYFAGMTALIVIGIVELPIALVLLGGHVLIKQHHSRSLSAIGEVVEDALGH